ncbi:MAG: DoxX family protein [Candidatus Eremiobacteraeota bacterium]|nr:DoxX family protein [Candidatus Eremiobacteraeota bacterium]
MENGDNYFRDGALLAARLALGASIASHGAQKLFGWFGGPGPDAASKMMDSLGFKPGPRYATMASSTEITSGLLIALGLGGPIGPAMLSSVMTVAAGSVHLKNGYFNSNKGFELNTIYTIAALLLASQDYGSLSLDHVIGLRQMNFPALVNVGAVLAGIAAGLVLLARREKAQPPSTTSQNGTPSHERTPAPA